MKLIPLSQGKFAMVDDEDFEWLSKWKWYYFKGYAVRNTKPAIKGRRTTIRMHNEIMKPPDGFEVDHRDLNKSNNQKYNMRNCTHAQNCRNRLKHRDNKTGFKGVSIRKDGNPNTPFRATISINYKQIDLGRFTTAELAHAAHVAAAETLHGEFAHA